MIVSVDDAFKNLAKQQRLSIPSSPEETDREPFAPSPPKAKPASAMPLPNQGGGVKTMAVSEDLLLDEADYLPSGGMKPIVPDTAQFSGRPTETDLPPSPAAAAKHDDVSRAVSQGAGLAGRDSERMYRPSPKKTPTPRAMPAASDSVAPYEEIPLSGVRMVRRFGYLALSKGLEKDMAGLRGQIMPRLSNTPSVAVCGATHGVGTTELALRLALAFSSRPESKILLMDFALGHPAVASRLGLSMRQFALADALRAACPPEDAMVRGDEDNLYVLPARSADREIDDLLDGRHARRLLDTIHASFDVVVIDCGCTAGPASTVLAEMVGCMVLTARSGKTHPGEVAKAAKRLTDSKANLAGMALIGF